MNRMPNDAPKWMRALAHLPNLMKLYRRLWNDPRVPIYRKAIPVLTGFVSLAVGMLYFAAKIDLIPDFLPFLGKADDLLVLLALVYLPGAWALIRLSPPEIVAEHIRRIDEERRGTSR